MTAPASSRCSPAAASSTCTANGSPRGRSRRAGRGRRGRPRRPGRRSGRRLRRGVEHVGERLQVRARATRHRSGRRPPSGAVQCRPASSRASRRPGRRARARREQPHVAPLAHRGTRVRGRPRGRRVQAALGGVGGGGQADGAGADDDDGVLHDRAPSDTLIHRQAVDESGLYRPPSMEARYSRHMTSHQTDFVCRARLRRTAGPPRPPALRADAGPRRS